MKELAGKVAFITGGGSGVALGQAAALKQYEDHPDYARRMKLHAAQGRPMPGAR
ncbi:MAG: hypothetical protein ACREFC_10625 [Stellaceae bacterium]